MVMTTLYISFVICSICATAFSITGSNVILSPDNSLGLFNGCAPYFSDSSNISSLSDVTTTFAPFM